MLEYKHTAVLVVILDAEQSLGDCFAAVDKSFAVHVAVGSLAVLAVVPNLAVVAEEKIPVDQLVVDTTLGEPVAVEQVLAVQVAVVENLEAEENLVVPVAVEQASAAQVAVGVSPAAEDGVLAA